VYLIILAVSGLFVVALARLSLPGRDPMSIPQTILLGLAGNFIAGIIVWLVWCCRWPARARSCTSSGARGAAASLGRTPERWPIGEGRAAAPTSRSAWGKRPIPHAAKSIV